MGVYSNENTLLKKGEMLASNAKYKGPQQNLSLWVFTDVAILPEERALQHRFTGIELNEWNPKEGLTAKCSHGSKGWGLNKWQSRDITKEIQTQTREEPSCDRDLKKLPRSTYIF